MKTQILSKNHGTQILSNAAKSSNTENNYIGGLLSIGDEIAGCVIQGKINASSGEADLYIAKKGEDTVVIKYYRGKLKAKDSVIEKIKNIDDPNIIKVLDYGYDKKHFYEIMQYAEAGSINDKNEDDSYKYLPFDEEHTIQMCRQVIDALKVCHANGIIHRDIKPSNIYFKDVAKTDFVIGDFGISSLMEANELIHKTQTASRTTGYAAPEVLTGNITPAMDYYALGIVIWEVMNAKDPFLLENGQRRNDAHLLRDTIEGRIADDLLSRKPFLSKKMQQLIRGLLVIDSEHRWGYDEVTRFLNGEDVPVYVPEKKNTQTIQFKLGEKIFDSLEDFGTEIMTNPDSAIKDFNRGYIKKDVEKYDKAIADKIEDVQEKASANNLNIYDVLYYVAYLLNPKLPLLLDNGYKANSIEEIQNIVESAPESISKYIFDTNSRFYFYLSAMGYENYVTKLKEIFQSIDITKLTPVQMSEYIAKTAVVLRNYTIKPFPMEKYKNIEISTIEQLATLPQNLQDYVLLLVQANSYDGFLVPWLELLSGTDFKKVATWSELLSVIYKK